MKRFFIILSICLFCIACSRKESSVITKKTSLKEVSYSSIYHIINHYDLYQDIDVIDVRSNDAYLKGHIIGSINIPYSELEDTEFDSSKRIIVYAEDRRKSILASRKLNMDGVDADYLPGIRNYPYELV